jgi:hypothetical protein
MAADKVFIADPKEYKRAEAISFCFLVCHKAHGSIQIFRDVWASCTSIREIRKGSVVLRNQRWGEVGCASNAIVATTIERRTNSPGS